MDYKGLKRLEELAVHKASVYGRTLTDQELAQYMQGLAQLHTERGQRLAELCGEMPEKTGKGSGENEA